MAVSGVVGITNQQRLIMEVAARFVVAADGPLAAIFCQQAIGLNGTPASRLVEGQRWGVVHLPAVQDGIDQFPSQFDGVAAGEERGIAFDDVHKQAFVGVGHGRWAEMHHRNGTPY